MTKIKRITSISQSATDALGVIKIADALFEKNKKFETSFLARSNKALYSILGDVQGLYQSAAAANCLADTTKEMKAALKGRGIRTQKNTPALTVFVRYVFNSDRKKAYNYANTLAAAIEEGIAPSDLANFIEGKGGIEECKKEFTQSAEITQKKVAHTDMLGNVLASLKTKKAITVVELANQSVDLMDGTHFAFLVARRNRNGNFDVLQAVPTTTKALENAALNELTKFAIKAKDKSDQAAAKNNVEKTTKKAISSIKRKKALSEAA